MVDRSRRVRWDYRPDRDELTLLGRLAIDELDGLPLALELAAARLGVMGARGLADRLRERFRLLRSARAGAGRFDSLQAAIAWGTLARIGSAMQATPTSVKSA